MEALTQEEIRKRICEQNDKVIVVGEYSGWDNGIDVQCKKCGRIYHAHIGALLNNHGCSECSHNRKLSTEEFTAKISALRDDIEILGEYVNAKTPILCRCKKCGNEFAGSPYQMLHKKTGCKFCSLKKSWAEKRSAEIITKKRFLDRLHSYTQDIELLNGEYSGYNRRAMFLCKKCGNIWSTFPSLLYNQKAGCPVCKESRGEKMIASYLTKNHIFFERQKTFASCVHKKQLRFDFYIPSINMCVEYDGEQHFIPVELFGGEEQLKLNKSRDAVKTKYCIDNGILLLRIPYTDYKNIEIIMATEIKRRQDEKTNANAQNVITLKDEVLCYG